MNAFQKKVVQGIAWIVDRPVLVFCVFIVFLSVK